MKVIDTSEIIHAVENLCITANYYLNNDILDALQKNLMLKNLMLEYISLTKLLKMHI